MNILRIVRHFNIKFKRATKLNNPKAFKLDGTLRKNATIKYNNEMTKAHSLFARSYNIALESGIDIANDTVVNNDSYSV